MRRLINENETKEYIEVDQESLAEGDNKAIWHSLRNVYKCFRFDWTYSYRQKLLSELYNTLDSRGVFAEAFVTKLKGNDQTAAMLQAYRSKGHMFKKVIRLISSFMLKMFAKNNNSEMNKT